MDSYKRLSQSTESMPEVAEPGEFMARSCRQPENSKAKHQQSLTHVTNPAPLAAKALRHTGLIP